MSAPSDDVVRVRALAVRYLDPRAAWTTADEQAARALREDPAARRTWSVALATHRALTGAEPGLPSGVEQRRQLDLALAAVGVEREAPSKADWRPGWLARLIVPLAAVAAGVLFALSQRPVERPPEEWIRARGLDPLELPGPHVGLGVGGVTEGGREYEAVLSGKVHLDDWLRFSYSNERPELGWLYVLALQPPELEATGRAALRPIAPLPEEGQSLAIHGGHFVPLPFEARLAARHALGPVRLVALFTARALTVDAVDKAVTDLDPAAATALPSEVEAHLRARLQLSPGDVVQILDTTIVPGSAALPHLPIEDGPRQETP